MTKIEFVGITLIISLLTSIIGIASYWRNLNKKDNTIKIIDNTEVDIEDIKIVCK